MFGSERRKYFKTMVYGDLRRFVPVDTPRTVDTLGKLEKSFKFEGFKDPSRGICRHAVSRGSKQSFGGNTALRLIDRREPEARRDRALRFPGSSSPAPGLMGPAARHGPSPTSPASRADDLRRASRCRAWSLALPISEKRRESRAFPSSPSDPARPSLRRLPATVGGEVRPGAPLRGLRPLGSATRRPRGSRGGEESGCGAGMMRHSLCITPGVRGGNARTPQNSA